MPQLTLTDMLVRIIPVLDETEPAVGFVELSVVDLW